MIKYMLKGGIIITDYNYCRSKLESDKDEDKICKRSRTKRFFRTWSSVVPHSLHARERLLVTRNLPTARNRSETSSGLRDKTRATFLTSVPRYPRFLTVVRNNREIFSQRNAPSMSVNFWNKFEVKVGRKKKIFLPIYRITSFDSNFDVIV